MYPSNKGLGITAILFIVIIIILSSSVIVTCESLLPKIGVEKGDPRFSHEGETLQYSIMIKNLGNCPLHGVNITDSIGTIIGPITLDVGDSQIFTSTYLVPIPSGDIINTIIVEGIDDSGIKVVNSTQWKVEVLHPKIGMNKDSPVYTHEGDNVTYTISVTNLGDCRLSNINITNSLFGSIARGFSLLVGSSRIFTLIQNVSIPSENISNIVDVEGVDDLNIRVTNSTEWVIDVLHPKIDVTKTSNKNLVHLGDNVTYTIKVKNIGDCALSSLNVTDNLMGDLWSMGILESGEEKLLNNIFTVNLWSSDSINNTVTVMGKDVLGLKLNNSASASVDVLHPKIMVEDLGPRYTHEGDNIQYSILIKNLGNCPIYKMNVTDSLLGSITTGIKLEAGASQIFKKNYTVPSPSDLVKTAITIEGVDPLGLMCMNSSQNNVIVLHPKIEVTKTSSKYAKEGNTIQYVISVRNIGDCYLYNINITDALLNFKAGPINLDVNDSGTFNKTYIVSKPSGDISNTAFVEGIDVTGKKVIVSAQCLVEILHPKIGIEKAGTKNPIVGENATYIITLKNLGDCPLSYVNITDNVLGDIVANLNLGMNASRIYTKIHRVQAVSSNITSNIAAEAFDPLGFKVSNNTSFIKSLNPASFKLSEMVVNPVSIRPGETLTLDFLVYNKGDLPGWHLCNVLVDRNIITTKNVTLFGGSSTWIRMNFTYTSVGGHLVQIDEKQAVFTVLGDPSNQGGSIETPKEGLTLLYLVGGIAMLGVGAVFMGVIAGAFMTSKGPSKKRRR